MSASPDLSPVWFPAPDAGLEQVLEETHATPPACVLHAIDMAFARVDELAAIDREVRFAVGAATGLEVHVRTRSGDVVRRISPAQALMVLRAQQV